MLLSKRTKGIRMNVRLLDEEQTRFIYETNSIRIRNEGDEPLKVDDILETVNHFRCFEFMLEHMIFYPLLLMNSINGIIAGD